MEITEQIEKLWPLLLEDPRKLDDEQISELLQSKKVLGELIYRLQTIFPHIESVRRYRDRKRELNELDTIELERKHREIWKEWNKALTSTPDEELEDSFFESPSIDSDAYIINEILTERKSQISAEKA